MQLLDNAVLSSFDKVDQEKLGRVENTKICKISQLLIDYYDGVQEQYQ